MLLFIFAFPGGVLSDFTQPETEQLRKINESSARQVEVSKENFHKAINEQVINTPERKEDILSLKKSWSETIYKKCKLTIFESLNTDAETAGMNKCLSTEYLLASDYFKGLFP